MRFNVTIKYLDGREFSEVVSFPEFMAFERSHPGKSAIGALQADLEKGIVPQITDVVDLAFLAAQKAHRAGNHPGAIMPSASEFAAELADLPEFAEAEAALPLDETAPSST